MFQAVYKNGAIVERSSFDMLPKSDEVLFYAKSEGNKSRTEYSIIDSYGEPRTLPLNGCRLIGCILNSYRGHPYIELEFEIYGLGVEKLQIWREEWQSKEPLSEIAHIIERVRQCSYKIFLELRKLEQENRKLRWENKDSKEEHDALLKHINFLETELSKAESQLK